MAGRIARHFIDNLLAKADIVSVVGDYVSLKKQGANYSACCPFHDEKTPSFTVSQNKQFYYCFGCGAHGNVIGFVQEYLKLEFIEAIEELANTMGMTIEYEEGRAPPAGPAKSELAQLFELNQTAAKFYQWALRQPNGEAAIAYLKDRGLSGDVAKRYGVGFAPVGWDNLINTIGKQHTALLERVGLVIRKDTERCYDRFRNRIMFPVRDNRGRPIAFGGRVLSAEDTPKYLNSPESPVFHKSKTLYGLYEAKQANKALTQLVITEGYMDVIALAQFGVTYAVATLGTATTSHHIRMLRQQCEKLIFCFDGDRAGRDAAWRALQACLPHMDGTLQVRFLFLPDGYDPDSYIREHGKDGFEQQTDKAMPLSNFMLSQLQHGLSTKHLDERAKLVQSALPLINQIAEGPYRAMLLEQLADICQTPVSTIKQYLQDGGVPEPRQPDKPTRLSTVAQTIALLVQFPELALKVKPLPEASGAKTQLLNELIAHIHTHKPAHTGMLLQQWPDDEAKQHLCKLASNKRFIESKHTAQEVSDLMTKIATELTQDKLTKLIEKSKTSPLSDSEKQTLRTLLAKTR